MTKEESATAKAIYHLKLHECIEIKKGNYDAIHVMRVPGGWIYEYSNEGEMTNAVFVPFGNQVES